MNQQKMGILTKGEWPSNLRCDLIIIVEKEEETLKKMIKAKNTDFILNIKK